MNQVLATWNEATPEDAVSEIHSANGSHAWSTRMTASRPFASEAALLAAADVIWVELDDAAQEEAYRSHPRLGESHATTATTQSLAWSATEQSQLGDENETRVALVEGNRLYEQRFGHIFIACATGKEAAQLLRMLHQRLENEPAEENAETAEQQRRITQLRLRRWLQMPAVPCEDV